VGQLLTTAALKRYSPAIVQLVEELAGDLRADPTDRPLAPLMRRFAFRVIATTVLGLDPADRDELFLDFETWGRGLFSFPLAWPGTPLARARRARVRLLLRLGAVLSQAQEAAARGEPPKAGGLDLLAGGLDEMGIPLSDTDVSEQLLLLLFAGYETTASSLSCLLLALLQHPRTLGWLEEELETLPWPPSAEEAVTAYDASRAPRLDALVKEVMRLTPPVGGFFRFTRQPITVEGIEIPADRVVQVSIAATHRLGEPGDDLESFRPQRHLEEGCSALLLPFGGGERVCLGKSLAELEIRLLAVGLLKQLRLQAIADQDLTLMVVPSPTPRDGLRVNVTTAPTRN
jgi:cytochrome P450